MKIKKTYQGQIPANRILNQESKSPTDTYSCKYINENGMDGLPLGSIVDFNGDTIPEGYQEVADEVITLYGGGATTSGITLSDDSSKFKRIKLICKCSTAGYTYSFESVYYSNLSENGVHTLRTTGRVGNSYTYNVSENITISGNKITRGTQIEDRNSGSGNERSTVTTGIYIVKVIGYIDEISDDSLLNINKYEPYSTDEIRIGTWINGKPIYRKVLTVTLPSQQSTWTTVLSNAVSDMDKLINITGLYNQSNAHLILPVGEGQYYINIKISTGGNLEIIRYGWEAVPIQVILEYTKTTD